MLTAGAAPPPRLAQRTEPAGEAARLAFELFDRSRAELREQLADRGAHAGAHRELMREQVGMRIAQRIDRREVAARALLAQQQRERFARVGHELQRVVL